MVPFPCVVYTRSVAGTPYVFSHACVQHVKKSLRLSLRVQDRAGWNPAQNWEVMRRACFLVLVAGDTAQCVSVANHAERRTPFLYQGSPYSRPQPTSGPGRLVPSRAIPSEFQDGHVALHFYSTVTCFDKRGAWMDTTPIEAGITLLPHTLLERDLVNVARWAENNLLRSLRSSEWLSGSGHVYNEWTRGIRLKRIDDSH